MSEQKPGLRAKAKAGHEAANPAPGPWISWSSAGTNCGALGGMRGVHDPKLCPHRGQTNLTPAGAKHCQTQHPTLNSSHPRFCQEPALQEKREQSRLHTSSESNRHTTSRAPLAGSFGSATSSCSSEETHRASGPCCNHTVLRPSLHGNFLLRNPGYLCPCRRSGMLTDPSASPLTSPGRLGGGGFLPFCFLSVK